MTAYLVLEDGRGNALLDNRGQRMEFTEDEARKLIGEQRVRPRRHANGTRYLVLASAMQEGKSKVERFQDLVKIRVRIPIAEPYVVAEHIGGSRVFMHVAHRCSAAAPGRIPVSSQWL